MKIVKITKAGLFYKVKFDNDTMYKLHESVIIKYGLIRKNIEISLEKLDEITNENEYYVALDKGVNYLTVLRSKKEVELYLKRRYDSSIIERVVRKLEELNLIDDKEYAAYFTSLMIKKGFGHNKIIYDLQKYEIPSEYISEVLEEYSEIDMITNCEKHFFKYLSSVKKDSLQNANKKMHNYLTNKGFSNEIITIVLEKNMKSIDNIIDEDKLLVDAYRKLLKTKKANLDEKKFKNKVIRSLTSKGFPLYKVIKIIEGGFEYDKK